jgi:hypothetical protein
MIQQVSRRLHDLPNVVAVGTAKVSSGTRHYQNVLATDGATALVRTAAGDATRGGVLLVHRVGALAVSLLPGHGSDKSGDNWRPPATETPDPKVAAAPGVATTATAAPDGDDAGPSASS